MARLGTVRSLVLGSVLVIVSNLMFMTLAWSDQPSLTGLALVVSADNLAMGVAGTALIAYLSSLTSPAYTATQYALFSSAYALPGKLLMGGVGLRRRPGGLSVVLRLYLLARAAGARAAVVRRPPVADAGERAAVGVISIAGRSPVQPCCRADRRRRLQTRSRPRRRQS